jgi:hypothetical protein
LYHNTALVDNVQSGVELLSKYIFTEVQVQVATIKCQFPSVTVVAQENVKNVTQGL